MKPSDEPAPAGSDLHDRLVAAAHRRFRRFGFRRTGIADVARDAGVAAGTVYRYFTDKEDLFRAVVRVENERWIALARSVLAQPCSATKRLAELARASAAFREEHVLFSSILARDTEMVPPPLLLEALQQELMESTVNPMAEVISQGIAQREFRELDPKQTARVLFLCGRALFREGGPEYPELVGAFGDLIVSGLRRASSKADSGAR
jgi:AcrR family transcriptional regulator